MQARTHTDLGASLFGAYYFRALDWSIATNDSFAVRQISARTCAACERVVATIEAMKRKGQVELGGRIDLHDFGVTRDRYSIKSDAVVRITYSEQAVRLRSGDTSTVTMPAVSKGTSLVFVNWASGSWQVAEVTQA